MKLRVMLTVIATAASCQAAEEHILPGTVSPNKEIAIAEQRISGGDLDYYFVHQPSGKRLGFVLPRDQRHQIRNVAIVASWNTGNTKVALLVFYGTKLSELLLYSRADTGAFEQVELREPDPVSLYKKRTRKTIPQPGDGYSENAVGPWFEDDTVALVAGEAKQIIQGNADKDDVSLDEYNHVFVTFQAHIKGRHAKLSKVALVGPLANAASDEFRKRWGERYFNTHTE